jgi:hypothetical protein
MTSVGTTPLASREPPVASAPPSRTRKVLRYGRGGDRDALAELADHISAPTRSGQPAPADRSAAITKLRSSIQDLHQQIRHETEPGSKAADALSDLDRCLGNLQTAVTSANHHQIAGLVEGGPPGLVEAGPPPGVNSGRQHSRFSRDVGDERSNGHEKGAEPGVDAMLSILMPAYNEQRTIARVVGNILRTELPCPFELIVVNDGSSDSTEQILKNLLGHPKLTVITHPENRGKGAALRTASATAMGTHIVPFDADLEYEPRDLAAMLEPVLEGRWQVVFGVRLFGVNTRYQSYAHAMGNRALTSVANILFGAYISDMHTCLKLLPVSLFRQLELTESGFGLDTELTAKLLRVGIRPFEVPVSYHSRSAEQGKKITWRHGVECVGVLMRERRRPSRLEAVEHFATAFQDALHPSAEAPQPVRDIASRASGTSAA